MVTDLETDAGRIWVRDVDVGKKDECSFIWMERDGEIWYDNFLCATIKSLFKLLIFFAGLVFLYLDCVIVTVEFFRDWLKLMDLKDIAKA